MNAGGHAQDPGRRSLARASRLTTGMLALVFLAALLPGAFLRGEVIAPADILYRHAPWLGHNPHAVEPGSYVLSDQVDYFLPIVFHVRDALAAGQLPWWSDAIQNGTPLLGVANHEAGALPLTLLALLFGVPLGYDLYLVGRSVLGAVFFFAFARRLGVRSEVATIGALVFSFSSFGVQRLGVNLHLGYVLTPLLLYAVDRVVRDRSQAWTLGLPLAATLLVAAGYPPVAAYVALLVGSFAIFRVAGLEADRLPATLRLGAAAALTALLASPFLVATADFAARGVDMSYRAAHWAGGVDARYVPTLLVPHLLGDPAADDRWFRNAAYLGILPLLAIAPGFVLRRPSSLQWFFAGFGVWLVLVLYDVGGFLEAVYRHLPVFNRAMPNMQLGVWLSVLSVLATLGLDDVVSSPGRRRGLALAASLAVLVALAGAAVAVLATQPPGTAPVGELARQGVLALLAVALIVAALWGRLPPAGVCAAMLVLVVVDLFLMGAGWNRTIPRESFFARTPGIAFLEENLGPDKLLSLGATLPAHTPLAFGLRPVSGRGFFSREQRELYRLLHDDALAERATYFDFPASGETRLSERVVDLLGVRYLAAPGQAGLDALAEAPVLRQVVDALMPVGAGISLEIDPLREVALSRVELDVRSSGPRRPARIRVQVGDTGLEQSAAFEIGGAGDRARVAVDLAGLRLAAGEQAPLVLFYDDPSGQPLPVHRITVFRRGASEALAAKLSLVYDGEMRVWENRRAFDRAFLVPRVETVGADAALAILRRGERDPAEWGWIVGDPADPHPLGAHNDEPLEGAVLAERLAPGDQGFRVRASRPALLVIGSNHHPGWRARVDGVSAPVLRVDYLLRGVAVPAGESSVELRYAPAGLLPAAIASGVTAVALCVAIPFAARRDS